MSVAASCSALQRARRTNWAAGRHGQQERDTVRRCMDAAERAESMTADLLSVDVVVTMPPDPVGFTGRDALLQQLGRVFGPASPHDEEWTGRPAAGRVNEMDNLAEVTES
ncbi:hypothetical protein [Streptomyces sp. 2231.1]|uniref:hypothetical protein n=1 Tax=Streptomyces sp. 2231.1 TaxID=1855347 RepID=UPI00115FA543|nr:hypothetical protein [Streptomyces sp. 2231.1]